MAGENASKHPVDVGVLGKDPRGKAICSYPIQKVRTNAVPDLRSFPIAFSSPWEQPTALLVRNRLCDETVRGKLQRVIRFSSTSCPNWLLKGIWGTWRLLEH